MKKKILITGSSGYIGSCLSSNLSKNYEVFNLDKKLEKKKNFVKINLLDKKKLLFALSYIKPTVIVHLAGESLVDEKKKNSAYYKNNVIATRNLIDCMKKNNIQNIIFSSTAAVYSEKSNPLTEKCKLNANSKYGKSKILCEKLIQKSKLNYIILRFFNVSGCLRNPLIGEWHKPETHLIPLAIMKSLSKKKFKIYGNNYKTKDGTCVRDYIHIKDICSFIVKSINHLEKKKKSDIVNLGSGKKYSVLQILNEIKKMNDLKFIFSQKRKGDLPILTTSIDKAKNNYNWYPKNSNINNIIKDQFIWLKKKLRK